MRASSSSKSISRSTSRRHVGICTLKSPAGARVTPKPRRTRMRWISSSSRSLYPNLSPEELVLAKENLDRYLSLAWEIYEDSRPAALSEPASVFPQSPSRGSIQVKVD